MEQLLRYSVVSQRQFADAQRLKSGGIQTLLAVFSVADHFESRLSGIRALSHHLFRPRFRVYPSECRRLDRSGSIGGLLSTGNSTSGAWRIIVITNVEAQPGRVDVAVTPEEEGAKDGFGHDIQDPIEHGFRVRSDDVSTLTKTPGDGVEEPQEDGPYTANEVRP